jgi:hypothetical protein
VAAALEELPVPKRAADVRPLIRSAIAAQIAADPELAALVADFQPAQLRRAG